MEAVSGLAALRRGRAADSFRRSRRKTSDAPLMVALTGTDLYHDLKRSKQAQSSLDLATRIVVLQSQALSELPFHLRKKTTVIHQSVSGISRPRSSRSVESFDVCVVGHLRRVKDPFRGRVCRRGRPT